MFGLELRRKNNITTLYRDADMVLESAGVLPGQVSAEVQTQAVAHSLQKMLTGSHFSICTIDQCIKIAGIRIQRERYDVYHAQHCVNWNEMLPEFRQVLVAMVLDDFREILNPTTIIKSEEK